MDEITLEDYVKYDIQVISKDNPLIIDVSGFPTIKAIVIEEFCYKPVAPGPTNSYNYMGIVVEGARGRFDQKGLSSNIVKTLPFNFVAGGAYNFNTLLPSMTPNDAITLSYNGGSLRVAFIDQTVKAMNPNFVVFDTEYLFVCSVYYPK